MPNKLLKGLWQVVIIDFITNQSPVELFDFIYIIVNKSTKSVVYISYAKTIDIEETANLYIKYVQKRYRLLDKIISNRKL